MLGFSRLCLPGAFAALAAVSLAHGDLVTHSKIQSSGLMGLAAFKSENETRQCADKRDDRGKTFFTGAMMKFLSGKKGMEARTITRLDKELAWSINPKEKEYTEMTFAEQREAMNRGVANMQGQDDKGGMPYKASGEATVDVEKTGKTFSVSGYEGKQIIATMRMPYYDSLQSRTDTLMLKYDAYLSGDQTLSREFGAFNKAYAKKMKMDLDHFRGLEALYRYFEKPMTKMGDKLANMGDVPLKYTFTLMKPVPPQKEGEAKQDKSEAKEDSPDVHVPTSAGDAAGQALGSAFGFFKKKKAKEDAEKTETSRAEKGIPQGWIEISSNTFEYTDIKVEATPGSEYELPAGLKKKENAAVAAKED
ncbi:MAG: hypothetical protein ABI036_13655 [Fibrobacteria bacterium]